MNKPLFLMTFGTRPEAIKMAPVVKTFLKDSDFRTKVVVTAQHRQMLDQVMELFDLPYDEDFNIMSPRQSLVYLTQTMMEKFEQVLLKERPSMVFVHGDTTTTYACALTAFYHQVPVAHVEAGLRSHDLYNPFPEEMNRKMTDALSSYHFCPTATSKNNLIREGIHHHDTIITGNTIVDALEIMLNKIPPKSIDNVFSRLDPHKKTILMTMHRRESWGEQMRTVAEAVKSALIENSQVQLLFPVHRNPLVREIVEPIFCDIPNALLVEPLDYFEFVQAMKRAYLIISDSGGIQEEAPSLGKPVLLTRKVTERPEGIEAGLVELVGTDYNTVRESIVRHLKMNRNDSLTKSIKNPFGDGKASERIHRFIRYRMGLDQQNWEQERDEFR